MTKSSSWSPRKVQIYNGDPTNLYRYCGNNPVTWRDPLGLQEVLGEDYDRQYVSASMIPNFLESQAPPNLIPWSGNPFDMWGYPAAGAGLPGINFIYHEGNGQHQSSSPSAPPPQNPPEPDVLDPTPETPLVPISASAVPATASPPATSVTAAIGPGVGVQFTFTWDRYGQRFFTLGGQAGKSWPVSFALTGNYVIGQNNPSSSQIAGSLRGFGWSASGGYYAGVQLGGPATWRIFLPSITGSGAEPPTNWGGGFVTPQAGVGVAYTWQLPTSANPWPPYSPYVPEGP